MMGLFYNASINTKLIFLTTIAVTGALTLGSAAFVVSNYLSLREAKQQKIDVLAHVIGINAISALEFDDEAAAIETLESLAGQANIDLAVLFDASGEIFATYPVDVERNVTLDRARQGFDRRHYQTVRRIRHTTDNPMSDLGDLTIGDDGSEGEATASNVESSVGSVFIRSNLRDIDEQVKSHIFTASIILVLSLLVSIILVRPFQRQITAPVHELVRGTRRISQHGDLDFRVEKSGDDEHGELCDAFNEMVEQIGAARQDLKEANEVLEVRVTERTHDLEVALISAQKANRTKSDFLANMSHEIRTPMTAIIGFAELLANDEETLSAEGDEQLRTIVANGRHLLSIVNDILDVSKIEAGKVELHKTWFSVADLREDLARTFAAGAQERGLELRSEVTGDVPVSICSDLTRLRQLLVNLIGNALKFTSQGSVHIGLDAVKCDDHQCSLRWSIRDTGIGMSEEQIESVFSAFSQADETITRRYGGTGLGLTICRGLTELLDGRLEVESEPGVGSTFTVSIEPPSSWDQESIESDEVETVQPTIANTPGGRLALLVDDGVDNRRLFTILLEKSGFAVTVAENGKIAVDLALEASDDGKPFDIVFMDMQMPVMDGYTATRILKARGYPARIVALTAHAMEHEQQKCFDAGCDDYLAKPVERAQLVAALERNVPQAQDSDSVTP